MSLWTLVQNYIDETGATEASIQRRAGLNKGTFTAWRSRGVPALPTQRQLVGLSEALKVGYAQVLDAVLHDVKYLPEVAAHLAVAGEDWSVRAIAERLLTEADGDFDRAVNDADLGLEEDPEFGLQVQSELERQRREHLASVTSISRSADPSEPDGSVGDEVVTQDEDLPVRRKAARKSPGKKQLGDE